MKTLMNRRTFLQTTGLSAALLPFLGGLPSLRAASTAGNRRQRIIFVFSPNGTIPGEFWPDMTDNGLKLKRILSPLEAWKDKMLVLRGVADQVRGDGDNHMRGMSCLLTGTELYPGNIQGGSHTPAGWAKGISIDQELKNYLQADPATRTRFGSLELGVAVPNRADPWTRWSYAGPNQPVAPIGQRLSRRYAGEPLALPPLAYPATPLAGVEPVATPVGGLLVFCALPGEYLEAGQLIAQVIDPIEDRVTEIHCSQPGLLYARSLRRMATAGMIVAHIAGREAYRRGYLLSP